MTRFPTMDEALALHQQVIARFGGTDGVRDQGLLESALFRPQTGYYDTLVAMAAALMDSVLTNHAFVDGNKRMAFFLADIFLRMNNAKISVTPRAGERFILDVLARESLVRRDVIHGWLANHVEETDSV